MKNKPAPLPPAPPPEYTEWPAVMTWDELVRLRARGDGPRGEWIWKTGDTRPTLVVEDMKCQENH